MSAAKGEAPTKRVRNPQQTRRKILEAAKAEFAAMGLKGARTKTIARRAGVNPQGISHHFGSKDELYTAVVASLFEQNWFLESRERLLAMDPLEAVAEIMDFMMERAANNPTFTALLLDANLHRAKHLRGLPAIRTYYAEVLETIGGVLRRGEASGRLHHVEPEFFYIMLMGALGSPTNARHLFSATFETDYEGGDEIAHWYRQFKAFVLRSLTREGGG